MSNKPCGPKCNARKCASTCSNWRETSNDIVVKVAPPIIDLPACANSPNCKRTCPAALMRQAIEYAGLNLTSTGASENQPTPLILA